MGRHTSDRFAAAPAASGQDPDATDVAATVSSLVAEWHRIDAALSPIVGRHGVAALFQRSVQVAAAAHPWLQSADQPVPRALDLTALAAAAAQQEAAAVSVAAAWLRQTFDELLASLIGPSLTARILDTLATPNASGPSAQDPSP